VLTEVEAKLVLTAFGVPVPREILAAGPAEAAVAAEQIGFPVVLKVCSPDITHKTEIGGVRVGLRSSADVESAAAEMMSSARARHPSARLDGLLVAEMVTGGVETIVGAKTDRDFGPTVLFGLGGIFVEVLEDIAIRVAPLSRAEAETMVQEIKGARILQGARGRQGGDVPALVETLLKISGLAVAMDGELEELDVNPLVVLPEGRGVRALDALMIITPASSRAEP
jgi:acetyltransferase